MRATAPYRFDGWGERREGEGLFMYTLYMCINRKSELVDCVIKKPRQMGVKNGCNDL